MILVMEAGIANPMLDLVIPAFRPIGLPMPLPELTFSSLSLDRVNIEFHFYDGLL